MTRPNSRRPMSRAAYQARLAALKAEHPWLAKQVVEPAPGHLAVLAHFVGQCELLMKPACWRRSKFAPPCRLNFDPGLGAGIG